MRKVILPIFLLAVFFQGCEGKWQSEDPVLAEVGSRKLFLSNVQNLINPGSTAVDSTAIVDGYVQNWIRENLMIEEAEKNVAADINLNKLVDDYRSSLLVYNFEKRLVDKMLDTIIPEAEKKQYYSQNKNQYLLSHPILKCVIAKVPSKSIGKTDLTKSLSKKDMTEAMFIIKEKATYHHLDTAAWITIADLNSLLPGNMLKNEKLSDGKVLKGKEGDSEFYVKILGYYDEKEIPPFDYIEGIITKTLLSERKIILLKKYRDDLFEKGDYKIHRIE